MPLQTLHITMDPNSHPADSDDHPHPKLVDFIGIFIAVLTLIFPISTVFRYSPDSPSSLSTTIQAKTSTGGPPEQEIVPR